VERRIVLAYRLALSRAPDPAELKTAREFVTMAPPDRLTAWEQFAQVLLASNEFAWVD
jgi:hypothetical protein